MSNKDLCNSRKRKSEKEKANLKKKKRSMNYLL